jgi:hypothetical protein
VVGRPGPLWPRLAGAGRGRPGGGGGGGAGGFMNGAAAMPAAPDPWADGNELDEEMEDVVVPPPPPLPPLPAAGAGAAGAAADDADGTGDGDASLPWPGLFAALDRLRVLRLRAFAGRRNAGPFLNFGGGGGAAAHPFQAAQRLVLDLYPLTCLQALSVHGWQLDPVLSRLGPELLGGITRLETDRVLTVEEWAAVRSMEGLTDVSLRAEVAGRMAQPMLSGGSVHVAYGMEGHRDVARGKLFFPLPPELRRERPHGGGDAAAGPSGTSGGPPLGINMFAAPVDVSERQWSQTVRQRMWELGELHVQLEPLR